MKYFIFPVLVNINFPETICTFANKIGKFRLTRTGLICLPLPYMKISLILAAELSVNRELKGSGAFRFVKGFYENLFGIALTDEEVLSWFHTPKDIKARLKLIKEKDFEILRLAIERLDSST